MATITQLGFNIHSDWDGSGVRAARTELDLLRQDMRQLSGAALNIDVVVDTERARAEMREFRESNDDLNVNVNLSTAQAHADLQRLKQTAGDIGIGFDINQASYEEAELRIDRLTRDRVVDIHFDINNASFAETEAAIAILTRRRSIEVDADRSLLDRLRDGFAGVGSAAAGAGDSADKMGRTMKLVIAGIVAAIAVVPGMVTAIGAALMTLPGIATIALGGYFLSSTKEVTEAFEELKSTIMEVGVEAAEPMKQPLIDAMREIGQWAKDNQELFRQMYEGAAKLIEPLTDSLTGFMDKMLPGVNAALQNSVPFFERFGAGFVQLGDHIGNMFQVMSTKAEEFGRTWEIIFGTLGSWMELFGVAATNMAENANNSMSESFSSFTGFLQGSMDGLTGFIEATGQAEGGLDFWRSLGDLLREVLPAVGQLYAAFSSALGPALKDLAKPLGDLIAQFAISLVPIMQVMAPILLDIVNGFAKFVDFLEPVMPVLGPVIAGIWLLNAAILANPIAALVVAIVGLTFYLIELESKTHFLKNTWDAVWGKIGEPLTNFWNSAKEIFQQMWEWLGPKFTEIWNTLKDAVSGAWDQIRPALIELRDSLQPIWDAAKPILAALGGAFYAAFTLIASVVVNTVIHVIKPIINGLVEFIRNVIQIVTGIIQFLTGIFETIKGVAEIFINFIKMVFFMLTGQSEKASAALKGVQNGFMDFFRGIGHALQGLLTIIDAIWDTIYNIFKTAIGTVIGVVRGWVQGIIDWFKHMWDVLVGHSIVPDMINAIVQWFVSLPGKILGMLADFVGKVINFFGEMKDKVWQYVQKLWDDILASLGRFTEWFRSAWNQIWDWVSQKASEIFNWVRDRWNDFVNANLEILNRFNQFVRDIWDKLWGWVKDRAQQLWDEIQQRWDNLCNNIRTLVEGLRDTVTRIWNDFWETVFRIAGDIWDRVLTKIEDLKNGVISTINFIKDEVKRIWDQVTGIFKEPVNGVVNIWNKVSGAFGLPDIPGLATGGPVIGPGTGTSDDIPVRLSNGEHVWTADEVNAAGGHGAIREMRQNVLSRNNYAEGGAVEWMVGQKNKVAPALTMTSGERYTDNGYHSKKQAADFSNAGAGGSPEMKSFANWIADTWGRQTLQLIHSPFNRNIANGGDVGDGNGYYSAGTMSEHRNHVHWAVPGPLNDDAMGSAIPGGPGSMSSGPTPEQIRQHREAVDGIRAIIDETNRTSASRMKAIEVAQQPGQAGWIEKALRNKWGIYAPAGDVHAAGTDKQGSGAISKLDAALASARSAIGGTIPEGERRAIIEKAMEVTNTPPPSTREAWLAGMNTLIERESGWNAGARNDWDSNAAAGNNSVGLAQVIPTTFEANKAPGYDNIYGAVDNVAASINYIKGRYGSIENVQQANANMPPKGYADGTNNARTGWNLVGENGPEMVKFRGGEQVKTFNEIIAALKNTNEYKQLETKVESALKELGEKVVTQLKTSNTDLRTALQQALAQAGMEITIPVTATGDVQQILAELQAQLLPKLEMMIRQGVGAGL